MGGEGEKQMHLCKTVPQTKQSFLFETSMSSYLMCYQHTSCCRMMLECSKETE